MGQLSLLPSVGRKKSTGQSVVMLCGWGVKAGMVHSYVIPRQHVPYLSALEMSFSWQSAVQIYGYLYSPLTSLLHWALLHQYWTAKMYVHTYTHLCVHLLHSDYDLLLNEYACVTIMTSWQWRNIYNTAAVLPLSHFWEGEKLGDKWVDTKTVEWCHHRLLHPFNGLFPGQPR